MHFNCMIALTNVPDTRTENIIDSAIRDVYDEKIAEAITLLHKAYKLNPHNFWIKLKIQELNCERNHFSRVIIPLVYQAMEPYNEQTEDEQYLEFFNVEDDLREEYENRIEDCVRLADGRIRPLDYRFEIIGGKVYQKRAGQLHHPMRTKKAKKMTAYPNYPIKKAFKSPEQYMKYRGYVYDEENEAYGFYANPDGYWDWFAFAGRWPKAFLVKNECEEYGVGHRSECDDELNAPRGYRWVGMARKKDIDWKMTYRARIREEMENYRLMRLFFSEKKIPEDYWYWHFCDSGIMSLNNQVYKHGESMYENLRNRGVLDRSKYHTRFYGYLATDHWEDEYVYQGKESELRERMDEYIDSLPDDAVLVAVDCHS